MDFFCGTSEYPPATVYVTVMFLDFIYRTYKFQLADPLLKYLTINDNEVSSVFYIML